MIIWYLEKKSKFALVLAENLLEKWNQNKIMKNVSMNSCPCFEMLEKGFVGSVIVFFYHSAEDAPYFNGLTLYFKQEPVFSQPRKTLLYINCPVRVT